MIPVAEDLADLGQGHVGHLPRQVHGDLPGHGDLPAAGGLDHVVHGHAVVVADRLHDHLGGDLPGLWGGQHLPQGLLAQFHRDGLIHQLGVGVEADEAPLQLTDVAGHMSRDELQHLAGNVHVLLPGLFPQDGDAGFHVGLLDVGDQAPGEAALEALLQLGDLLGRTVAGEDDLLAGSMQGVEGMEEFLLGGIPPGDELDIVHHEDVYVAEAVAELHVPALLDGGNQLVGEVLAGDVEQALLRVLLLHIVADGVHEVGLAQAHAAVDEQRVVRVRRGLSHRQRRRMGEAVAAAHHEGVEGVLGVELHGARVHGGVGLPGVLVLILRLGEDFHAHGLSRHLGQARSDQRRVAVGDHHLHVLQGDDQRQHIAVQGLGGQVRLDPGLVGGPVQLRLELLAGLVPQFMHVHALHPPRRTVARRVYNG